jgi:hypothetical protein
LGTENCPRTIARQTHRAPRSRAQTHGQCHRRSTEIAAIGIMSTHFLLEVTSRLPVIRPRLLANLPSPRRLAL